MGEDCEEYTMGMEVYEDIDLDKLYSKVGSQHYQYKHSLLILPKTIKFSGKPNKNI